MNSEVESKIENLDNMETIRDMDDKLWIRQLDVGELLNIRGIRNSTKYNFCFANFN